MFKQLYINENKITRGLKSECYLHGAANVGRLPAAGTVGDADENAYTEKTE